MLHHRELEEQSVLVFQDWKDVLTVALQAAAPH